MELSLLIITFILLAPLSAFLVFKTQVCLQYGKRMASEAFLKMNPNGYQDALTDPKTNKWFFLIQGGLIANIIAFFYFHSFWVGAGSIVAYFVVMSITTRLLPPPDSPKWAVGLHGTLARREADYKRDGDELRYQAAKEIREMFEVKFLFLSDKD